MPGPMQWVSTLVRFPGHNELTELQTLCEAIGHCAVPAGFAGDTGTWRGQEISEPRLSQHCVHCSSHAPFTMQREHTPAPFPVPQMPIFLTASPAGAAPTDAGLEGWAVGGELGPWLRTVDCGPAVTGPEGFYTRDTVRHLA